MLRKMMGLVLMAALCGGVALGDAVQVQGDDLDDSRSLSSGLTGVGSWSSLTITWGIDKSATTGLTTYEYSFSGDGIGTWYLEVSPGVTNHKSFRALDNTALELVGSVTVSGKTLDNALKFTSAGTGGAYKFETYVNPIWGDAFIGTSTSGKYAYNDDFDTDPILGVTSDFTGWVATVDTGSAGDLVIPEPSLSVLALTALLAGAVARRRKKEDEV